MASSAQPSPILVQKYGGSSVATPDKLRRVAARVCATRRTGRRVVVVVSAMGKTTDGLLELAAEVSEQPHHRELDMLLSTGERVSMALLAMAIREQGFEAVSLTGSQAGIITTTDHNRARIIEVRPIRVVEALEQDRIVIVGGFQGVSTSKEVTTLGRGGSDTTAIALAAALEAEACEILSDVDGVYSADPRVVPDAHKLDRLDPGEVLEMGLRGAKVLAPTAIDYARRHGITLRAASTFTGGSGTVVTQRPHPGTGRAVAVAADRHALPARWEGPAGSVGDFLGALEAAALPWKDCRRHRAGDRVALDLVLDTLNCTDPARALAAPAARPDVRLSWQSELGTATLVGEGIAELAVAWRLAEGALAGLGIDPPAMWGSPYGLTAVVPRAALDDVVRAWHAALPGIGG